MNAYYEQKPHNLYGHTSKVKYFPAHLHSNIELIFVEQGKIHIEIDGKKYHLQKNDLAVIFPNIIHSYISSSIDNQTKILICNTELYTNYFNKLVSHTANDFVIKSQDIHSDVIFAINSLYDEARTFSEKNSLSRKALTELILSRVLPTMELENNTSSLQSDTTSQVIKYICNNFNSQLSLDSISHELGINKFLISRIFSSKIGVSFNDYINNLRIDLAKKLLLSTEMKMQNIANECGFDTQRNFNRIFKKITDTTPLKFKLENSLTN